MIILWTYSLNKVFLGLLDFFSDVNNCERKFLSMFAILTMAIYIYIYFIYIYIYNTYIYNTYNTYIYIIHIYIYIYIIYIYIEYGLYQLRVQKVQKMHPVKHLWWSFVAKMLKKKQPLTIFLKYSVVDIWVGLKYATEVHIYFLLFGLSGNAMTW